MMQHTPILAGVAGHFAPDRPPPTPMAFCWVQFVCLLLVMSAASPLVRAWRATRHTSLGHAVVWAFAAWSAWAVFVLCDALFFPGVLLIACYSAVALTACAGVAVLGARRPGVAAWNFVVLGLLSVLLLPLAQGFLTGSAAATGGLWTVFLSVTLGIGLVNYFFTRLAAAAALLAAACATEIAAMQLDSELASFAGGWLAASAPWVGWAAFRCQRLPSSAFDRSWLDFRNRFGLIWAQRLREQFNRSVANAGWHVELGWSGLRRPATGAIEEAECLSTLRALMKRFGVD